MCAISAGASGVLGAGGAGVEPSGNRQQSVPTERSEER
jgi:hypothetical protein